MNLLKDKVTGDLCIKIYITVSLENLETKTDKSCDGKYGIRRHKTNKC